MGLHKAGLSVILLHAGPPAKIQDGPRVIGFTALENMPILADFQWSGAVDTYLSALNFSLYQSLARAMIEMKIDILQIEGPWSIAAAELLRSLVREIPLVYDAHNVESLSVRYSSRVAWAWPYARFIERKAAERSTVVFCVSELDKSTMYGLYGLPSRKLVVIPNGVRTSIYETDYGERVRILHSLDHSKIIFFHGDLSWKPNTEAAQTIVQSIAPRLERENPEMVFVIAGGQAPRGLLEQARAKRNVRIVGFVPNISEYISAADVCIAPMRASSGTKLKILEYLAAGKPLVATRNAVEGFPVQHGRQALLTDDIDEEFIQAIRAAATPELSHNLGRNAKEFAAQFEWSSIAERAAEVYETIVGRFGGRG